MDKRNGRRAPIVVINGCPRSGTSLLSSLLAKRLNASAMPETHFIPIFHRYLFLWNHLSSTKQREHFIKALFDFTEIRMNGSGLDVNKMRKYCVLAASSHVKLIAQECRSYPEILFRLFEEHRKLHEASISVEKTAYYKPVSWQIIADSLPSDTKFIHISRDGRDVLASWVKTWFGPKNTAIAAKLWAEHIREGLLWEKNNPDKCIKIRYEDLTKNHTQELTKIAKFLGIPLRQENIEQPSAKWHAFLKEIPHMVNLNKVVLNNNAEKWRTSIAEEDIVLFEHIAGQELIAAGYKMSGLESASFKIEENSLTPPQYALRNHVSKVEMKRIMSRYLPPFLWLFNRIGVSLPRLLRIFRFT